MRRCLAGYIKTFSLALPHKLHRFLRGYVTYMIAAAGLPDNFQVTLQLFPFCLGTVLRISFVLAVRHDHLTQLFSPGHGVLHHIVAFDSTAVVAESYDIIGHSLKISHLFTLLTYSYGTIRSDTDDGIFFYGIKLDIQVLPAVRTRIQIRHGKYIREAPCCGCHSPGFHSLLI